MLGVITNFDLTVGLVLVNRRDPDKVFEIKNMSTISFNTWKTLTNDNHIINPIKKYMKIHFMSHQGLVKNGVYAGL